MTVLSIRRGKPVAQAPPPLTRLELTRPESTGYSSRCSREFMLPGGIHESNTPSSTRPPFMVTVFPGRFSQSPNFFWSGFRLAEPPLGLDPVPVAVYVDQAIEFPDLESGCLDRNFSGDDRRTVQHKVFPGRQFVVRAVAPLIAITLGVLAFWHLGGRSLPS